MAQFRPGGFQMLPLVIKNLLIINGLIFLAQVVLADRGFEGDILNLFALHNFQSPLFKPHQLITHLFMHGGFSHIFFNMFALWMFGSVLENVWGPKRFLTFYLACGLGAAFLHLGIIAISYNDFVQGMQAFDANPTVEKFQQIYASHLQGNGQFGMVSRDIIDNWLGSPELAYARQEEANYVLSAYLQNLQVEPTLGASGAVFGCLAAFAYLFPNSHIYLYFLFPIKVKWFVLIYAGIELVMAIQNSAGDNVAHWAHLGGAAVGFLLVYFWNKTNRRTFY